MKQSENIRIKEEPEYIRVKIEPVEYDPYAERIFVSIPDSIKIEPDTNDNYDDRLFVLAQCDELLKENAAAKERERESPVNHIAVAAENFDDLDINDPNDGHDREYRYFLNRLALREAQVAFGLAVIAARKKKVGRPRKQHCIKEAPRVGCVYRKHMFNRDGTMWVKYNCPRPIPVTRGRKSKYTKEEEEAVRRELIRKEMQYWGDD